MELLIIRQYFFLTIYFSAFEFITLSDLNSDLNHLIEFFFITVFWVDCLICLNISLIALKMSKSSLLKLILINLQLSSCSITFCFFYFIVNTSVTASIFINFCCDFIVTKIQVNSIIWHIILCLHIFSSKSTHCFC